jgi:hypothetical protein
VRGTLNDTQKRKKESERIMKNKMIGIFAVLIAALMLTGISYALWDKYINIIGTVHTGSFDAIFAGPFTHTFTYDGGQPVPSDKVEFITVDVDTAPGDTETLVVTITGLYPSITVHINYYIVNPGTTPWVVQDFTPNVAGFPGTVTFSPDDLIGTQVDQNQHIPADIEVHLTNDAEKDSTYSFGATIHVVQWNEYVGPPAIHPP